MTRSVPAAVLVPPNEDRQAPGAATGRAGGRADPHERAVELAVETMRLRMAEPLSLDDLAHAALLSPFHFHRIFRQVTGVPPGRFLAAVRMQEARRLLLTTRLRVTDVCLEVGYQSLGTFTTRFRELVGLSPRQLRRMAGGYAGEPLSSLLSAPLPGASHPAVLDGHVDTGGAPAGPVLVAAFAEPIPERLPLACAVCRAPGEFRMSGLPDGPHHLLAIAFPGATTVLDALLCDTAATQVAARAQFRLAGGDGERSSLELSLREMESVDPPFVLAGPLLLAAGAARHRAAR